MAIVDVIKYNGGPDVFAWKYPNGEIGTWSQLIVNESQEAIIFKGGKALDVFQSGRHKLDTANLPLFNKIINIPFGGRSPFTAEIWYINKIFSLDIKWGTATPIQLQDPKYNVFLPLRSHGQFGIRIADSKLFITSLVGTLPTFGKNDMTKYFRGVFLTKVKDTISTYLVKKKISVLEINSYLDEISDLLKEKMLPILSESGIELVNFYVNDISVPEEDPAVIQLKKALAKKAEMDIIGYNYQQERSFDTMEGAATNPGTMQSGIMGAGLGLGMGVGMGNYVGNEFNGIANQNLSTKGKKKCAKCGHTLDEDVRFCSKCGYDTSKEEKSNAKNDSITCAECSAVFSSKFKFCPECGNPYNQCPNCKADMPEDVDKCPQCGYEKPGRCPNCDKELPGGKLKFCPECGHSMEKKCPKCDSVVDKGQKFCPECGEKL